MKNLLKVNKIIKKDRNIRYLYEYDGLWKKCLSNDYYEIEYNQNIESVPDDIAIIPFICNILPILFVFDLYVEVDCIDNDFYNSIPNIRKGYQKMYPQHNMKGTININRVKENHFSGSSSIVLFSGGVDAFNTLFNHIKEHPMLLTLWGADIGLNDEKGWQKVQLQTEKTARDFNLNCLFCRTNFKSFINGVFLSRFVSHNITHHRGDSWYHEFQHGIGIISHAIPLAFINKSATIYIASSFTPEFKGKYTCASDPMIDNELKFANCKIVHDGYKMSRQDKIDNICASLKKNNKKIFLRVCWESSGGNNCCACEKCYRTILGIIASGGNPIDFGFDKYYSNKEKMIKYLKKNLKYDDRSGYVFKYLPIQNKMKNNNYDNIDFKWFVDYKIASVKPSFSYSMKQKVKRKISMIIK